MKYIVYAPMVSALERFYCSWLKAESFKWS